MNLFNNTKFEVTFYVIGFIALIIIIILTGCMINDKPKKVVEEFDTTSGQLFFIVNADNWGEYDITSDIVTQTSYRLRQNSKLEIYESRANSNDEVLVKEVEISKKDLNDLYTFAVTSYRKDAYKDLSIDACDGTGYSFVYVDETGEQHNFYTGYIYGEKELEGIINTLKKYNTKG